MSHASEPASLAASSAEQLDELPTERPNPRTADLDQLDTLGILQRLNAEDGRVAEAVRMVLPELAQAVELALERWQRGGRVILFGAGTSGRLAALDAAELGPTFGVPPGRYVACLAGGPRALLEAVEGAEDDRQDGARAADDLTLDDLAIGIAASGRTPWVLAALGRARERGAATVGLACVPQPALAALTDVCIAVDAGPESIAGSTRLKAGTAQKLVLNAFSSALMVRLGKVYSNLMVDVRVSNAKLRRRAVRLIRLAAGVGEADAEAALAATDGEVKTAIAMLRLGTDVATARQRLADTGGHLRDVLGEAGPAGAAPPADQSWAGLQALLIDLDGVVYTGREAIPGAADFLAEARRRGLAFLLVTNNSTASPARVADRLRGMHIDVQPEEILTSAQAAVGYVAAHAAPGARVRVIGEEGLREAATDAGLRLLEDGQPSDEVDWVIVGLDRAFSYEKLTLATRAILAGAHFVATNADALLPVEGGDVMPGAGSLVAAIRAATSVEPVIVGKPAPGLFEHGLARLGSVPPGQAAMIGDRLDTDVVGGMQAGLRTILVLSGVTTREALAASGVQPDAVLDDLAAVAGLLGWSTE